MFVLSGPLGSLPPQVLLTRKPPETVTYMGAEWLIKTNAVSVVPSVSSFVAIRSASHTKLVVKKNVRYLGLGNPSLDGNPSCGKVELPKTCKQLVEASLKKTIDSRPSRFDYLPGSYFRGNIANLDKVRKICPLPETEREIECVGQDLGASHKDFLVRSRLTETNLKRMRLEDYRIIHFATHGLLAEETHDLSGLSPEPALVMTPPASPTDDDDGLLTASEISRLKLKADWVILSACNTAAGERSGADALSGLARAFFLAGTRSLLASHWAVDSKAAVLLTTQTFDRLRTNPSLTASEALQQSMLTMISDSRLSHPTTWAPFTLIGENSRR